MAYGYEYDYLERDEQDMLLEQYMDRFPKSDHLRKLWLLQREMSAYAFTRLLSMALSEGSPLPVEGDSYLDGT